jgi:hypothetical protein
MDAVEFYKSMKRMCYSGEMCEKCPLYNNFSEMGSVCDVLLHIEDEEASKVKSIVEQWAKDHPVKTRQSEFLKMFPKAEIKDDYLWMCPKYINYDYNPEGNCHEISCSDCKRKFWLTEVTDND